MHIYRRTPAGNDAALNAKASLPRKLRTLLMVVDGKTELDTYLRSLSSFGDVGALLGALEEAGLVELVMSTSSAGASSMRSTSSAASFAAVAFVVPATGRSGFDTPSIPAGYQLRKALLLMSDFVTLHLPEQSLEIVLALESLDSVEQLIGNLKGYEALVAPLGVTARQHLAEVRQAMTTA